MTWPATGEALFFAGYRSRRDAADRPVWDCCKGQNCGARILWAVNPQGNKLPLERVGSRWQPHFFDCPDRDTFTRRKPAIAVGDEILEPVEAG